MSEKHSSDAIVCLYRYMSSASVNVSFVTKHFFCWGAVDFSMSHTTSTSQILKQTHTHVHTHSNSEVESLFRFALNLHEHLSCVPYGNSTMMGIPQSATCCSNIMKILNGNAVVLTESKREIYFKRAIVIVTLFLSVCVVYIVISFFIMRKSRHSFLCWGDEENNVCLHLELSLLFLLLQLVLLCYSLLLLLLAS